MTSDELSDILYTSGTTGDAKPVAVSHANLTYPTFAWGHLFQDVGSILCAVPLGTNAGHNALVLALTTDSAIHVLGAVGSGEHRLRHRRTEAGTGGAAALRRHPTAGRRCARHP
ncbi:hypothetical protein GCM10018966_095450 [Streptomyces yanii]